MASDIELEIADYELTRIAKNIVVIGNPKVKAANFRIMKGIANELSISPIPYLLAARRSRLIHDTMNQEEARRMARKPASLRRRAERSVALMSQSLIDDKRKREDWIEKRVNESRDYREKLLRG